MDLEPELRTLVQSILPIPDVTSKERLHKESTYNLLVWFFTWRNRLIHPHPRRVRKSSMLLSNAHYKTYLREIGNICAEISLGKDLSHRLSKATAIGYEKKDKPIKKRQFDGLLNDWGIHHVHLDHAHQTPLLAIIFKVDTAYMLDFISHGEWTDDRLVQAAMDTWPEAGLFWRVRGITGERVVSPRERAAARSVGANVMVSLSSGTYMGEGITSARTPLQAGLKADRMIAEIEAIRESPEKLINSFRKIDGFSRKKWPKRPRFEILHATTPDDYRFVIREVETGYILALSA